MGSVFWDAAAVKKHEHSQPTIAVNPVNTTTTIGTTTGLTTAITATVLDTSRNHFGTEPRRPIVTHVTATTVVSPLDSSGAVVFMTATVPIPTQKPSFTPPETVMSTTIEQTTQYFWRN